jgi:hypothetical protein
VTAWLRWWSMGKIVDQLVSSGALPPGGVVSQERMRCSVSYLEDGLRREFSITGHKHDAARVTWNVFVGDEKYMQVKPWVYSVPVWLPDPTDESGNSVVTDQKVEGWWVGYRRPVAGEVLSPHLVEEVTHWAPAALAFVRDRADLGRLLLSESDVLRADVRGFLRWGNLPSRLVAAVVIARDSGDVALEAMALEFLRSHENDHRQGWEPTFGASVARWAKDSSAKVDVSVEDLVQCG